MSDDQFTQLIALIKQTAATNSAQLKTATAKSDARLNAAMAKSDARLERAIVKGDLRLKDATAESDIQLKNVAVNIDAQLKDAMAKNDEQHMRTFKYLQEQMGKMEKRLEGTATVEQFDRILNTLDGFAKRQVIDDDERTAMSGQLDRHDGWIQQLAQKTETNLIY